MELRGRLPGCTRLATGPSVVLGMAAKSVSWLLSTKPRVTWKEPMLDSTVVVMLSALPWASTMLMWVVPDSLTSTTPCEGVPKLPAWAVPMLLVVEMSAARWRR
jgi:hypothetical protein